jgi:cobalt-precorrin 5A hydrolase
MECHAMIVAGFGFRVSASETALREALERAQAAAGVTAEAIATAADKAGAPALVAVALRLNLPLFAVPLAELGGAGTLSRQVPARYGGRSLAEASALAAAGPGARLLVGRVGSADGKAMAAMAESSE